MKKFTQMNNELVLFSTEQGNLLIRLLLAHIISDFVLQTDSMVQNKKWFSLEMLYHIVIVFLLTFLLSSLWKISLFIAVSHWITDGFKIQLKSKYENEPLNIKQLRDKQLFIADQLVHFIIIAGIWFWYFGLSDKILKTISLPFTNYKFSLLLLGYIWLIYPVGYLIKFITQSIAHTNSRNTTTQANVEHGGKLIGQFERIIILTLVLFNQYEAIGFLITGKSIIRFADHNSDLRSEYVLVGTMMSYAIAILTGVTINFLLSI